MTLARVDTLSAVALLTDQRETLRPITVSEYLRMFEAGILSEDEPLELLDGMLFEVMTESHGHLWAVSKIVEHVVRGLSDDALMATVNGPFEVQPDSLPQPDLAVVDRPVLQAGRQYPSVAHLCIEVSLSSRYTDLKRKAEIYARAHVREYWVVDLEERVVHVHVEPRRGAYAIRDAVAPPAELTPSYVALPPLAVETLFIDE